MGQLLSLEPFLRHACCLLPHLSRSPAHSLPAHTFLVPSVFSRALKPVRLPAEPCHPVNIDRERDKILQEFVQFILWMLQWIPPLTFFFVTCPVVKGERLMAQEASRCPGVPLGDSKHCCPAALTSSSTALPHVLRVAFQSEAGAGQVVSREGGLTCSLLSIVPRWGSTDGQRS